jgi:hypothetical protein
MSAPTYEELLTGFMRFAEAHSDAHHLCDRQHDDGVPEEERTACRQCETAHAAELLIERALGMKTDHHDRAAAAQFLGDVPEAA